MIWLDAHLSPALATWLSNEMGQPATHLRALGLRHAKDREIFAQARQANVMLMTKDVDFVDMVMRMGTPPSIIWLTCGNTSNDALKALLRATLTKSIELIGQGEPLVEITDTGLAEA